MSINSTRPLILLTNPNEKGLRLLWIVTVIVLIYSLHFSHYSAPIHGLVHGHMTSNNETVSCYDIYDVKRETVHCFPRKYWPLLHVIRASSWRWSDVVAGISARFFKICFCFVLLYNKSLNDSSLGKQWILFPSNLNVSLDIEILGKQNSLFRAPH